MDFLSTAIFSFTYAFVALKVVAVVLAVLCMIKYLR